MDLHEKAAEIGLEGTVELLRWKAEAEPELEALKTRMAEMERQLSWFRHQLFGASSERRLLNALPKSDQLWLGEQFLKPTEEAPPPSATVKSYERQQRKQATEFVAEDSRLKFDETVPVQIVEVPHPDTEGLSEDDYEVVDHRVTYRLAQREGPYVILKYVQPVVKLKGQAPSCPAMPAAVLERSFSDVSFLAGMVVDKFQFHLPLYRQHLRLAQAGISLHRSTLTRQIHRVGELLEPIYTSVLSSILDGAVVVMDESPTKAGRANKKMKQGYYWSLFGDRDEVAFMFSPSRGRTVIDEALSCFAGTLVSDGYKAYESFAERTKDVVHAQCWAHARRKFIEAEAAEPEKCAHVIGLLQKLYEVERRARGRPKKLNLLRQTESKPLVDAIFEFLQTEFETSALLPSNPFTKAVEYAVVRRHQLSIFLENPEVPIDTNSVERSLRGPAVGRKNWMFHMTEVGARHGAIFYSLVQSCILAGVRPAEYLVDVLQRIEHHPAAEVHLLTPRLWREHFASNPLRSDLVG